MRNLLLRVVFVITLVGVLVILPANLTKASDTNKASDDRVSPYSHCSLCAADLEACYAGCPLLGEPGHFFCMRDCNRAYQECEINCYCYVCAPTPSPGKKPKR